MKGNAYLCECPSASEKQCLRNQIFCDESPCSECKQSFHDHDTSAIFEFNCNCKNDTLKLICVLKEIEIKPSLPPNVNVTKTITTTKLSPNLFEGYDELYIWRELVKFLLFLSFILGIIVIIVLYRKIKSINRSIRKYKFYTNQNLPNNGVYSNMHLQFKIYDNQRFVQLL